jgi:hypothetical protein
MNAMMSRMAYMPKEARRRRKTVAGSVRAFSQRMSLGSGARHADTKRGVVPLFTSRLMRGVGKSTPPARQSKEHCTKRVAKATLMEYAMYGHVSRCHACVVEVSVTLQIRSSDHPGQAHCNDSQNY